jgi:Fe-S-cluster containining protein
MKTNEEFAIMLSMYYIANGGLCFSCQKCSACCRFETGVVYLTDDDLRALAAAEGLREDEFAAVYCRKVWASDGGERLSLRERETASGYDCVFWKEGCSVYNARPRQCRTYPFWDYLVASKAAWDENALQCPGANHGRHYTIEEIDALLGIRNRESGI